MNICWTRILSVCFASIAMVPSLGKAQDASTELRYWLTTEAAAVWQGRNVIEIPKGDGSRFSFRDFGDGPFLAGRIYAGLSFWEKHELRALYAPLSISASGKLEHDTDFVDQTFYSDETTEALYRFDSYRLTYRYRVYSDEALSVRIGFTGKIRDAEIRLKQGRTVAARKNTGFVPLLHAATDYKFLPNLHAVVDVDALAAPQGRAEDVALLAAYDFSPEIQVYGGYRTVEGGSDGGGNVYNFTWLNYAVAGMTWMPVF